MAMPGCRYENLRKLFKLDTLLSNEKKARGGVGRGWRHPTEFGALKSG
jgi:hypothetical protein